MQTRLSAAAESRRRRQFFLLALLATAVTPLDLPVNIDGKVHQVHIEHSDDPVLLALDFGARFELQPHNVEQLANQIQLVQATLTAPRAPTEAIPPAASAETARTEVPNAPTEVNPQAEEYLRQGNDFFSAGRLEKAALSYSNALSAQPKHKQALLNLAVALFSQGAIRWAEADDAFELVVRHHPVWADAHATFGLVLAKRAGTVSRGEEGSDFERRHKSVQPHSQLQPHLSSSQLQERALHHYRSALQLSPAHYQASKNMGALLHHLKRWDEAVVCMQC